MKKRGKCAKKYRKGRWENKGHARILGQTVDRLLSIRETFPPLTEICEVRKVSARQSIGAYKAINR